MKAKIVENIADYARDLAEKTAVVSYLRTGEIGRVEIFRFIETVR